MTVNIKSFRAARRAFLGRGALGLGGLALATLGGPLPRLSAAEPAPSSPDVWPGTVRPLHVPPKAKRVIFLCMAGGPSQFETFDHKPELARRHGQPMPDSVTRGHPIAQLQGQTLSCLAPQFAFQRWGQSQQEISVALPSIASVADDICIVRSMVTDAINHDPAHTLMNTGTPISGRPSMGSWLWYGLGSEATNLPGFVVMVSVGGRNPQPISSRQWHSGLLPGRFQGVALQTKGEPIHYIRNPAGVDRARQRDIVDTVRQLDQTFDDPLANPDVTARIAQYELAFQMQASVPGLMDLSDEPKHVLDMYGASTMDGSFAANCILARRLVERGVRFVQLYHRGWDHHNDVKKFIELCASHCDRASAALIRDLKQRDMLKDTLVVWTGEFGRTPMAQLNKGIDPGRDHHMKSFSLWLAGGGIRGGQTYGATDELGYHAVENVVHVHDLHATMLHLLGVDHRRLTVRSQGRDFRLTDISGQVVSGLMEQRGE